MKTNNLSKKSFLTSMILMATALFAGSKSTGSGPVYRGSSIGGLNPIYIPRKGIFKGYMRENRRSTFNKNK
jgi:hypothetical protein